MWNFQVDVEIHLIFCVRGCILSDGNQWKLNREYWKIMELKGVYTALVTPFAGGKVDYDKLRELVEMQIAGNVSGIVPVGTTGESPTLNCEEHIKVIKTVIDQAAGRCQIIAGTGANATAEAIALTKEAKALGADATLQVTPYYNKPTQEGLFRHFSAVADEGGLPVVLYHCLLYTSDAADD